jgi:hypothetical protein
VNYPPLIRVHLSTSAVILTRGAALAGAAGVVLAIPVGGPSIGESLATGASIARHRTGL